MCLAADMTLNTLRILGSLIGFVIYFLLLFGINSVSEQSFDGKSIYYKFIFPA